MFRLVAALLLLTYLTKADPVRARAVIFAASQDLNQPLRPLGTLDFTQIGANVHINGTLQGLAPGPHGFHIHEKGDLSNGCVAAGGHFNPTNKQHGAPTDINRHVGDLGNVNTMSNGLTPINIDDSVIALSGPFSIIGRAVVVHEKADDLGRGNTAASKTTGDAGNRVACGIIGIVAESDTPLLNFSTAARQNSSPSHLFSSILMFSASFLLFKRR